MVASGKLSASFADDFSCATRKAHLERRVAGKIPLFQMQKWPTMTKDRDGLVGHLHVPRKRMRLRWLIGPLPFTSQESARNSSSQKILINSSNYRV
jgi:hypothetical protein